MIFIGISTKIYTLSVDKLLVYILEKMRYLLNNDNVTGEAILISLALIVIISTLATLYCLNNYFFRLKSPKMTCILNSRTLRLMNVTRTEGSSLAFCT